jgi:hypothetical protein
MIDRGQGSRGRKRAKGGVRSLKARLRTWRYQAGMHLPKIPGGKKKKYKGYDQSYHKSRFTPDFKYRILYSQKLFPDIPQEKIY